jgi:hypothetical protein
MALPPKDLDLKMEIIAALRVLLPKVGGQNFEVRNAYPTLPSLLPCISVTQASGGLDSETIGEQFTETVQDTDDGKWYTVEGAYYRQSVEVTVWALTPDDRDLIKRAVRKVLWRVRKALSDAKDLHKSQLSEQGDSQDFDKDAPNDIFMYTFEISGVSPITEVTPLGDPAEDVTVTGTWVLQ